MRTLKVISILLVCFCIVQAEEVTISDQSQECIDCHTAIHPGNVSSWLNSRHAVTSPAMGMQKPELQRRISTESVPENLRNVAVGCYECHSLNTEKHADSFEHFEYKINLIVSPDDCQTCHPVERQQYSENLMSHAYGNLMNNTVYQQFMGTINGRYTVTGSKMSVGNADDLTREESCLYCHGTKIIVAGTETRETELGDIEVPVLKGWPNQGVGRINPDGSMGACSACHTRHNFSVKTARQPYTCKECHVGPDVPAYKVYSASKHGNLFSTHKDEWNFTAVPWVVGENFTAPTCATCHASLLVDADENIIAERTHKFNDRLAWRLFGVLYAHPHPQSADLSIIKNKQGLPLATELTGEPVNEYLISAKEQGERDAVMQGICKSCHHSGWVDNHFKRLKNTITETNKTTLTATQLISRIWQENLAQGLPQQSNLFDEYIERVWTDTWLFHTNSIRFTAAMGGGGDYGVFANGRYQLTNKLFELDSWYKMATVQSDKK
jgi:hypothetical protein